MKKLHRQTTIYIIGLLSLSFSITSCNKDVYEDPVVPAPSLKWSLAGNIPTGLNLSSVGFSDSIDGMVAGDSGVIGITHDGGLQWEFSYPFPGYQLNKVVPVNKDSAWVAGSQGLLAYTTDGGLVWTTLPLGSQATFNDLVFSGQKGWIAGSLEADTSAALWSTVDGGLTWTSQHSQSADNLFGVYSRYPRAWAAGLNGRIIRTEDGGTLWEAVPAPTTNHLKKISFYSDLSGFAIGENGTLLRSLDGGGSWSDQNSGTFMNLNDIQFIDSQSGWIVGNKGKILKTGDGGLSWIPENSGTTAHLNDLFFLDATRAYALGITPGSQAILLIYK